MGRQSPTNVFTFSPSTIARLSASRREGNKKRGTALVSRRVRKILSLLNVYKAIEGVDEALNTERASDLARKALMSAEAESQSLMLSLSSVSSDLTPHSGSQNTLSCLSSRVRRPSFEILASTFRDYYIRETLLSWRPANFAPPSKLPKKKNIKKNKSHTRKQSLIQCTQPSTFVAQKTPDAHFEEEAKDNSNKMDKNSPKREEKEKEEDGSKKKKHLEELIKKGKYSLYISQTKSLHTSPNFSTFKRSTSMSVDETSESLKKLLYRRANTYQTLPGHGSFSTTARSSPALTPKGFEFNRRAVQGTTSRLLLHKSSVDSMTSEDKATTACSSRSSATEDLEVRQTLKNLKGFHSLACSELKLMEKKGFDERVSLTISTEDIGGFELSQISTTAPEPVIDEQEIEMEEADTDCSERAEVLRSDQDKKFDTDETENGKG